jgi:hypothetical protein
VTAAQIQARRAIDAQTVMRAVITILDVERNRMGALKGDVASCEPLRELAVAYGVTAHDRIDQAIKVMRAFLASEEGQSR